MAVHLVVLTTVKADPGWGKYRSYGYHYRTPRYAQKSTPYSKSLEHTVFEIFIFCPKIQLWFPEKIVIFFGWKTRENVVVLDFLAVGNFDFTRKIVKKILGEKLILKCWF